jgi:hypothetical protein
LYFGVNGRGMYASFGSYFRIVFILKSRGFIVFKRKVFYAYVIGNWGAAVSLLRLQREDAIHWD